MILASWRDTPTREALVAFAEAARSVPPEERIAVFDNDGTLWCEKPMPIELGFTCYIASGGDRDFMRPVTQTIYNIPSERVIGSSNGLRYEPDEHGGKVVYLAEPDYFDDGPVKPVRIWSRVGRRPILAFGNSDGDLQMLQYTMGGGGPRLALILHHDDAEREAAYDRQSKVGKLDKALDEAIARGWNVVSMKNDWKQVFAEPPKR